jgi:ABC-2 type transport system ATP-binding protein
MIVFRGVWFGYDARRIVLRDLELQITPGLTLVLGGNGSGKSTLLKLAAGVERPERGTVSVAGHDLWSRERTAREQLAYVPDQPDLTPYASIGEILQLVARLRGQPRARAHEALEWAGLDALERRTVRALSAGQRRRVALAAARIGAPDTLILDEPLEALDRDLRDAIVGWVAAARAAARVVVVATHDVAPFAADADAAVVLAGGRASLAGRLPRDPGARRTFLEGLGRS